MRWKAQTRWWLFGFGVLALAFLFAGYQISRAIANRRVIENAELEIAALVSLLAGEFESGQVPNRDRLVTWGRSLDINVALLNSDGEVLAELAPQSIKNLSLRPEYRRAMQSGADQSVAAGDAKTLSLIVASRRVPLGAWQGTVGDTDPQGTNGVVLVWKFGLIEARLPSRELQLLGTTALGVCVLALATLWIWTVVAGRRIGALTEMARRIITDSSSEFSLAPSIDGGWRDLQKALEQLRQHLIGRQRVADSDRQRVEAVLASMVEGVLALDGERRIIVVNRAARDLLGLPAGELYGRYAGELIRNPSFEAAIEKSQRSKQPLKVVFETVRPRRRTLGVRISPLGTHPETALAIVMHDVTELRRLESVRRDFVANVSHELKTPLAAIKAYTETLMLGAIDDSENNRRFLSEIETQAHLLEMQILDLLQLARVESGRVQLELEPIDLNEACRQCVKRFESEAQHRQVELELALAEHDQAVLRSDAESLDTILDNLLSNAIRYTPAGGRVTVSTNVLTDRLVVAISDTGIGIASEHHDRIFERFYRVDKARSRELGGTGLGLSLVKHTVEILGAEIQLKSQIGRGSTFSVTFPRKEPAADGVLGTSPGA